MPSELAPEAPDAALATASPRQPDIDGSWLSIVEHWRLVIAELRDRGIDLYDPTVRAGSWLGVRAAIFSLLDSPSRLRAALTRR